jgi:C4-dicarboxylate-specific signal transduction histidine kinase
MQGRSPESAQLLHDLNQPLSAINTYAQAGLQLIEKDLADPARLKDLFSKIAQQCARATVLSKELRQSLGKEP